MLAVPPKFATPRNPGRPTRGTRQGDFARIWLGQPLMPWQRQVLEVAGELDDHGLPVYKLVVVTVQRQAGKSHLVMARKGERCFSVPGYRAWYTAQTGGDARDQFLKFGEQVEPYPLGRVVRTLVGNGREIMRFPNGSQIRPHPPTAKALHGKQSDDNDVDEGWAFTVDQGRELLQAIGPTQLTRPGAQTWVASAGGTAASTWLAELVARGRGGDPAMAYFEWGIPDDADAEDLDVIAEYHPAFGHTITLDALRTLRAQFGDDASGWARAAGNRWTEVIGGAIRADVWKSVRWTDAVPDSGRVAYGAARSEDGTQVAIAAAVDVDGTPVVEILDVLPTAWRAAEHVIGWATDGALGVDPSGPSAGLYAELERANARRLLPVTARDASAAVMTLLDALPHRGARFRPHPALDAAVRVAGTRSTSDGGKAWARVAAGAPIAAIEAATMAVHALGHAPAPVGAPRLITASR